MRYKKYTNAVPVRMYRSQKEVFVPLCVTRTTVNVETTVLKVML